MDEEIPIQGSIFTVTHLHPYRVDIFFAAVDDSNTEIDNHFNEVSSKLLYAFLVLNQVTPLGLMWTRSTMKISLLLTVQL